MQAANHTNHLSSPLRRCSERTTRSSTTNMLKAQVAVVSLILLALRGHAARAADPSEPIQVSEQDPTLYFESNSLHTKHDHQTTFDDYITYAMHSLALIAGFDNDLHRYDSRQDLIDSFARLGNHSNLQLRQSTLTDTREIRLLSDQSEWTLIENQRNQETCHKQLMALLDASRQLLTNTNTFLNSKQLSLINFIDSYGSAPGTQLMMGNTMWFGSYEQCTQSQVTLQSDYDGGGVIETRYCVANFRSPQWKPDQQQVLAAMSNNSAYKHLGSHAIKLGVCLPKACNSLSIIRHAEKIESLIKLVRLNQVPLSSFKLTNLYCLPDEQSPLRQFSRSAQTFLITLSAWSCLVVYFSLAYEFRRARHLSGGKHSDEFDSRQQSRLTRVFAFRLCWRSLFGYSDDTRNKEQIPLPVNNQVDDQHFQRANLLLSRPHLGAPADQKPATVVRDKIVADHHRSSSDNAKDLTTKISVNGNATDEKLSKQLAPAAPAEVSTTAVTTATATRAALNLNVVDGVKVLSMIWLISAHTMLFLMRTISNGRDFWSILLDARFMTVMAGIFPVDSFFTITGILTAYLKFNKNHGQAMHKPKYWIEAFVHRYLRFMPMYIIIFWYTRDVSEYIGSGPLWDYATADSSLRSMCKRESPLVPLLFQANQKPIEQHCVKPAWYLANDYQYLLITPLYMALIIKSSLLGYAAIGVSVLLSLVAQFCTVYFADDFTDFEGLINFKPMFAAYVLKNLWRLYVMPYNRIAPYLIGIFTGHLIYSHKLKETAEKSSTTSSSHESLVSATRSHTTTPVQSSNKEQTQYRVYLAPFKGCIRLIMPLILLISIIYLPLTTKYITYSGYSAQIGASLLIALMRLVWSIAIARLIYVCVVEQSTGGFISNFLSSHKWKPWSRIGLSVLLIQWEVIGYFAQTQASVPYMSIGYLLSAMLICSITTYALGLLTYLTIEYPLSQIEHLYIHPKLFPNK